MSGKQFLFVSQITASGIHTLVSVRRQKNNARRCMWLMKPLRSSGKSKVRERFLPLIAGNLKNNVECKTTLFCGTFFLVVKTKWSSSPVKFLWRSDLWYFQIVYLGIAGLRSVSATQRHGETQPCGPTLFLSICFWPKRYPFHKLLLKKKKIKIKINKNMVPL